MLKFFYWWYTEWYLELLTYITMLTPSNILMYHHMFSRNSLCQELNCMLTGGIAVSCTFGYFCLKTSFHIVPRNNDLICTLNRYKQLEYWNYFGKEYFRNYSIKKCRTERTLIRLNWTEVLPSLSYHSNHMAAPLLKLTLFQRQLGNGSLLK